MAKTTGSNPVGPNPFSFLSKESKEKALTEKERKGNSLHLTTRR
jgi:hypothetical protein